MEHGSSCQATLSQPSPAESFTVTCFLLVDYTKTKSQTHKAKGMSKASTEKCLHRLLIRFDQQNFWDRPIMIITVLKWTMSTSDLGAERFRETGGQISTL